MEAIPIENKFNTRKKNIIRKWSIIEIDVPYIKVVDVEEKDHNTNEGVIEEVAESVFKWCTKSLSSVAATSNKGEGKGALLKNKSPIVGAKHKQGGA